MISAFFHSQPSLNSLLKNSIKLYRYLISFFQKYEKGGKGWCQIDHPQEKISFKKPHLIRVKRYMQMKISVRRE